MGTLRFLIWGTSGDRGSVGRRQRLFGDMGPRTLRYNNASVLGGAEGHRSGNRGLLGARRWAPNAHGRRTHDPRYR